MFMNGKTIQLRSQFLPMQCDLQDEHKTAAIQYRFPVFCVYTDKLILNLIWKYKALRTADPILKMSKITILRVLNFKAYYKNPGNQNKLYSIYV